VTVLDEIAIQYTEPIDRRYPPMRWYVRWSDGTLKQADHTPHLRELETWLNDHGWDTAYGRGMWLISDEGHGVCVSKDPNFDLVGASVIAWTRREAEARFRMMAAGIG